MVSRKAAITRDLLTPPLFNVDSSDGRIESDTTWRQVAPPKRWGPLPLDPFVAVDFETYYTDRYSLTNKEMSPWDYVAHHQFNAYLVALELWDGRCMWRWVGHPKDAPWRSLPWWWWSHNASFDELVARRLERDGIIPKGVIPDRWDCTADLAAYLQFDRGLEACGPQILGEVVDKSVRAKAKHGAAGAVEMKDYAATDGRQCAGIVAARSHEWPEQERFIARLQRRANYAGFFVDLKLMAEARAHFVTVQNRIAASLPWANRYPATSPKGILIECAKRGIPAPASISLDEEETVKWQKKYDLGGWLEKMRDYSKATQQIAHIDMLRERTRKDGTVPFELVYRQAPHTARFQTKGGMRLQNLDRDEFEGFNPRWYISCPDGWQLLSGDLSQIEPRVLNWLVGNKEFLDSVRKGFSPYDSHAIATMGYSPRLIDGKPEKLKKFSPGLYALAKARLLALGYRAGPPKFCVMARTMAGITIFEEESSYCPNPRDIGERGKVVEFYRESQVRDRVNRNDLEGWAIFPPAKQAVEDYRAKEKKIVAFWYQTEREMRKCVGGDHFVPMPDGSWLRYFDIKEVPGDFGMELDCWVVKNSKNPHHHKRTHGGVLTENRVQRVSRDVLVDIAVRIARLAPQHLKIRWSTHDELNAYVRRSEAKHLQEAFLHEMTVSPKWALDLPLNAEVELLERYKK